MENIKREEHHFFFMPHQKEAKNFKNREIHRQMKKMGIKEYVIRKHVQVIINESDKLKFSKNSCFQCYFKEQLIKIGGSGVVYLRAK